MNCTKQPWPAKWIPSLGELEMIFNWRMITNKGRSGFSIVYESSRCSPAEDMRSPKWASGPWLVTEFQKV